MAASKENLDRSKEEPESASASETSSSYSGDASDRTEVDIATQVLTSRSEEYRLLFRLPLDEVLVQDFNCALHENFLLQGHMYVFIHHICFYSNIFGFETKKTIPFHEITCIRKAKTAAIFPNAVEIIAGERKHFFGSFLSRDEAYRLIVDGWAQHSSEANALLDCQELKSDNTQDSGIVIAEKVAESAQSADASSSADRSKDGNDAEQCKSLLNGENNTKGSETISETISEHHENGKDEIADHLSVREPLTWKIEDFDAPKMPEYFTLVIEAKFPVCVEEFFNLFISDRASDFMENFHRRCGDKDFHCTPWRQHGQSGHTRNLSFLHPVKVYIGAKLGRCQEVQKYHVYRNSHLVIETSQHVSDVPFADYFHVERIWKVEKNDKNSCNLRVYFNVPFSKKTMFKGKIEQSTRDELREVHAIWINNAHELLKQKNLAKQKEIASQNAGMIQDQEEGGGTSSTVENLHRQITSSVTPWMVPVEKIDPQIDNHVQENPGSPASVASFFRESWATLLSYTKSQSHFPLYLAVAMVTILILMQITIVILLTRVPQVHVVTQGDQISSVSGYSSENIEWLEKRVDYLKEEMLILETRMERMHHEHAVLKAHLHTLERLRPKS